MLLVSTLSSQLSFNTYTHTHTLLSNIYILYFRYQTKSNTKNTFLKSNNSRYSLNLDRTLTDKKIDSIQNLSNISY